MTVRAMCSTCPQNLKTCLKIIQQSQTSLLTTYIMAKHDDRCISISRHFWRCFPLQMSLSVHANISQRIFSLSAVNTLSKSYQSAYFVAVYFSFLNCYHLHFHLHALSESIRGSNSGPTGSETGNKACVVAREPAEM